MNLRKERVKGQSYGFNHFTVKMMETFSSYCYLGRVLWSECLCPAQYQCPTSYSFIVIFPHMLISATIARIILILLSYYAHTQFLSTITVNSSNQKIYWFCSLSLFLRFHSFVCLYFAKLYPSVIRCSSFIYG